MTGLEMIQLLQVRLDKVDSYSGAEIYPDEALLYLNIAQQNVVKQRQSGHNPAGTGMEQSRKRIEDLKSITTQVQAFPSEKSTYMGFKMALLPLDMSNYFLFMAGRVTGSYQRRNFTVTRDFPVHEVSHHQINSMLQNPFNQPDELTVLATFDDHGMTFYGKADISEIHIAYLRMPAAITEDNSPELPSHMHIEIVNEAVKEILSSMGHPQLPYSIQTLNTQE